MTSRTMFKINEETGTPAGDFNCSPLQLLDQYDQTLGKRQ